MAETKSFDPAVIASLSTGINLAGIPEMREAASFLLGFTVQSHEFPTLSTTLKEKVLEQFPNMPTEVGDEGWEKLRDNVRQDFGPTVEVKQVEAPPEETQSSWQG